jgi:hypothetical protein
VSGPPLIARRRPEPAPTLRGPRYRRMDRAPRAERPVVCSRGRDGAVDGGYDQMIDDTNPANIDRTGNSTTLASGPLVPDYGQLRSRMPTIVVSNKARLGSNTQG